MKHTYLFELKGGECISTENTTPQRAYNHLIMKGHAEPGELVSCYHVAIINGQIVRFGLDLLAHLNQIDKTKG